MDAVITSFNQKTMISEDVASLKSQTLKPKRIIIVDDGSTDQTYGDRGMASAVRIASNIKESR